MKAAKSVAIDVESGACLDARELRIVIRPHSMDFWEYHGTRAQIEAEGIVPASASWPEGSQRLYWDDGCFRLWLRRIRPDGLKGPMRLWTRGDWWRLRCDLRNASPEADMCRLRKMKAELAEEFYRQSPEGRRERRMQWSRYQQSCEDKAFQLFKVSVLPERPKARRLDGTASRASGGTCR